jgi:cytochrome P450
MGHERRLVLHITGTSSRDKSNSEAALRLRSPVNRSVRTCSEDCVLPRGGGLDGQSPILVPSGTVVDTNFGQLHRDKDIWGDDADEFRPERWEGIKPMWDYVPFLGGPRMCPAQQQALTQMGYILVRLTREFEIIENRDEVFEFVEEHVATVKSRNGVKVAFP